MMRFRQTFFFAVTVFLYQLTLVVAAQNQSSPSPKWEYKLFTVCSEPVQPASILGISIPISIETQIEKARKKGEENTRAIEQLGEEGWELIKVERDGGERDYSTEYASGCQNYYFKRLKSAASIAALVTPPDPIYPKCLLRSDKAPALQGLRLGMKKEEVLKLFKFSNAAAQPTAPTINDPNQLPDEIEFGGLEPLTPVSNPEVRASVTFFEDELIRYRINYEFDHTWNWTLKEWKRKVTATHALPETAWDEITDDNQTNYKMTCRDFAVETGFTGANDHLQIQVTSLTGQGKVKKAREVFMQAKRSEFKP
jgi:hypothetical protein